MPWGVQATSPTELPSKSPKPEPGPRALACYLGRNQRERLPSRQCWVKPDRLLEPYCAPAVRPCQPGNGCFAGGVQGAEGGIAGVPISRHGIALSREGGLSIIVPPVDKKPRCRVWHPATWGAPIVGRPPPPLAMVEALMRCIGASRRCPSRRSARLGSVHQRRPEFKSVLDLRRRHAGTQPWAQVIQAIYSAAVSIQIVEKRLDARVRRGRHCHQSAQHLRLAAASMLAMAASAPGVSHVRGVGYRMPRPGAPGEP